MFTNEENCEINYIQSHSSYKILSWKNNCYFCNSLPGGWWLGKAVNTLKCCWHSSKRVIARPLFVCVKRRDAHWCGVCYADRRDADVVMSLMWLWCHWCGYVASVDFWYKCSVISWRYVDEWLNSCDLRSFSDCGHALSCKLSSPLRMGDFCGTTCPVQSSTAVYVLTLVELAHLDD